MFFKSATIFQLQETIDFNTLEAAIPLNKLKECGAQDEFSFGFLPLFRNSEAWTIKSNSCLLMRLSKEEKVLPPSFLKEELEKKTADIELNEGRKVGRKEKADIKDELIYTLRPKAFSKRSEVWLHIDNQAKIVVIYSTAGAMIEHTFKKLQQMLQSFPMTPLQATVSPISIITEWLQTNSLPSSLETGDECTVQDGSEDNAKVTFKALEPLSEDVTRFLKQGMNVKSLALSQPEKMNFTLNDDLSISKISWFDSIKESAFNSSQGGASADMDATFAITSLMTRELFESLCNWFEITTD